MATPLPAALIDRIMQSSSINEEQSLLVAQYGDGYTSTALWGLNAEKQQWGIDMMLSWTEYTTVWKPFYATVGYFDVFEWDAFGEYPATTLWRIEHNSVSVQNPSGDNLFVGFSIIQEFRN